jgi:hypothetical protein
MSFHRLIEWKMMKKIQTLKKIACAGNMAGENLSRHVMRRVEAGGQA